MQPRLTEMYSHELFVHVCFGLVAYTAPPSGGAAMNGGERKRLKLANKQPLAPLKVPLSKQMMAVKANNTHSSPVKLIAFVMHFLSSY